MPDERAGTRNPYSIFREPVRWWRWRRIQSLHREYGTIRVELNEFERNMLIPELMDRAKYMQERFELVKSICEAPATAYYLTPALRSVIPELPGMSPEEAAKKYLHDTAKQVDESFLSPLRLIQAKYRKVSDVQTLIRLLNDVRFTCEVVIANENLLFRYRMMAALYATNKTTGKLLMDEPQEIEIILTPFRPAIDELKRSATSTVDSIKHWKDQLDASKKPFLEFLVSRTNAATSWRTIVIQVLAIMLSLSFSTFFLTARDAFGLMKEKAALQAEVQRLQEALNERRP